MSATLRAVYVTTTYLYCAPTAPPPRPGSFSYTVTDGSDSAEDATVYLVSAAARVLAATDFDFGIDTWKVRSSNHI